jgi:hypothetical protein
MLGSKLALNERTRSRLTQAPPRAMVATASSRLPSREVQMSTRDVTVVQVVR